MQNTHCKKQMPKILNKYSQKRNCAATVLISTFMILWAIYKFPRSICLFFCREICGLIIGIYKIVHRHMNVESGTAAAQFSGKEYINGIFVAVHVVFKHYASSKQIKCLYDLENLVELCEGIGIRDCGRSGCNQGSSSQQLNNTQVIEFWSISFESVSYKGVTTTFNKTVDIMP